MTPQEFGACMDAAKEKQKRDVMIEYVAEIFARTKKLNDFETEYGKIFKDKKQMTDADMLKQVRMLNKLFGGAENGQNGSRW